MADTYSPRVSRRKASELLTGLGYPTAYSTLAKLAVIGGGPRFSRFGRRVNYERDDLIQWAQSKTTARVGSTSELRSHPSHVASPSHRRDGTA